MTGAHAAVEYGLGAHHALRLAWRASRPFAIAAAVVIALFLAFAVALATVVPIPPGVLPAGSTANAAIFATLALVVLPALGGGGDQDLTAFAAVRAGRAFRAGAHAASTTTDVGAAAVAPAIVMLGAAAGGGSGLLLGLALAVAGLGVGQVVGALAGRIADRLGPTWTLLIAAAFISVTMRLLSSIDSVGAWTFALAHPLPTATLLAVTGVVTGAIAGSLTTTGALTVRHGRTRPMPASVAGAVAAAFLRDLARSTLARNALITAALIPVIGRAAGYPPDAVIGIVVVCTTAVMAGANGFAYDAGAPVWLLGRSTPAPVLLGRYASALAWTGLAGVLFVLVSWALGIMASPGDVLQLALIAVAASAAGLVPSVRRPLAADMDLRRAQPASPVSAIGVLVRSLMLAGIVVIAPWWFASGCVALYVALAFVRARRFLVDPVALTSLA